MKHRTFKQAVPDLRHRLLELQHELGERGVAATVILAGHEGAGKGQVVNRLNAWLDPRGVRVSAFWHPSDETRERPPHWRFWQALPPVGEIALLFGGWYQEPLEEGFAGRWDDARVAHALQRIRVLERMLVEDGRPVLKLWYELDAQTQRQRLDALGRNDRSRWRMLPSAGDGLAHDRERFTAVAEQLLEGTDAPGRGWQRIDATDPRERDLRSATALAEALSDCLRVVFRALERSSRSASAPVG